MRRLLSSALLFGVVVLVAIWLVSPAGSTPTPQSTTPSREETAATAAETLREQADRLHQRVTARPSYPAPTRNPFSFGGQTAAPRAVEAPAPVAVPLVSPLLPRLVAIASNEVGGVMVRTAVVSDASNSDVRFVKSGESLGNFRVESITTEVVELVDPATGVAYRLALH